MWCPEFFRIIHCWYLRYFRCDNANDIRSSSKSKEKYESVSNFDYVIAVTLMGTFVSCLGGFIIYNFIFPKTIAIVHDSVRLWDFRTPIILGEIGAVVGLLVAGITTKNKNYKVILITAIPVCVLAAYLLSS